MVHHGYATEACRRLLQFAFQETPLTEVVATFDDENIASRNVLEKAGFTDCGTMRCYGEDGLNYRITREAWLKMPENIARWGFPSAPCPLKQARLRRLGENFNPGSLANRVRISSV